MKIRLMLLAALAALTTLSISAPAAAKTLRQYGLGGAGNAIALRDKLFINKNPASAANFSGGGFILNGTFEDWTESHDDVFNYIIAPMFHVQPNEQVGLSLAPEINCADLDEVAYYIPIDLGFRVTQDKLSVSLGARFFATEKFVFTNKEILERIPQTIGDVFNLTYNKSNPALGFGFGLQAGYDDMIMFGTRFISEGYSLDTNYNFDYEPRAQWGAGVAIAPAEIFLATFDVDHVFAKDYVIQGGGVLPKWFDGETSVSMGGEIKVLSGEGGLGVILRGGGGYTWIDDDTTPDDWRINGAGELLFGGLQLGGGIGYQDLEERVTFSLQLAFFN